MGYVLPWGQMSFRGAYCYNKFIFCNSQLLGKKLLFGLWGGYAIANATLTRFYALHFLFPILIASLVGIPLIFITFIWVIKPYRSNFNSHRKFFLLPYYIIKDLYGIIIFLRIF
jgi:ubiquinol-cytochrome c reductase cytochrome b subunit